MVYFVARFGPFCGDVWYPFSGAYWYALSYHLQLEELVDKLTPEQAHRLTQKAELHAKALPEPEWSRQEGHWTRLWSCSSV